MCILYILFNKIKSVTKVKSHCTGKGSLHARKLKLVINLSDTLYNNRRNNDQMTLTHITLFQHYI